MHKINVTNELLSRLGKTSDREVAESIGTSVQIIYAIRKHVGIAPYYKHGDSEKRKLTIAKTDEIIQQLGSKRDSVIAREFHVSREYVRQLRKKHGIQKFSLCQVA